jgi:hypothetical protein
VVSDSVHQRQQDLVLVLKQPLVQDHPMPTCPRDQFRELLVLERAAVQPEELPLAEAVAEGEPQQELAWELAVAPLLELYRQKRQPPCAPFPIVLQSWVVARVLVVAWQHHHRPTTTTTRLQLLQYPMLPWSMRQQEQVQRVQEQQQEVQPPQDLY